MRMPVDYIGLSRGFTASHLGLDFGWNSAHGGQNVPVFAVADGVVIAAVDGYGNTYPNSRIYGNYVIVDHGGGLQSLYAHALRGSVIVKRGQTVKQGQQLCRMNNSGFSAGSHLHFEVRKNGRKVDPLDHLFVYPGQMVSVNSVLKNRIKHYTPPSEAGHPVARDTSKDQAEILIDNLRARKSPSLQGASVGFFHKGFYDVQGEREADGYTWLDLGGLWGAHRDGWMRRLPKESATLYTVTAGPMTAGDRDRFKGLAAELAVGFVAEKK